jgi:hypothetical protein
MSPARPADPQIPNSIKERTDCTSSPATPVVPEDPSRRSRRVSLPRSAREEDSRVRRLLYGWPWHYESSQVGNGSIWSIALGHMDLFCIWRSREKNYIELLFEAGN